MNKEESIDRILELQRDLMLKDIDYNFEYIVDKRIKELQQKNIQLKEEVDKYKRLIEYLKTLDLYEFELDYDYEENPVSNYYPANMEYHINNWLEIEELEKGNINEME